MVTIVALQKGSSLGGIQKECKEESQVTVPLTWRRPPAQGTYRFVLGLLPWPRQAQRVRSPLRADGSTAAERRVSRLGGGIQLHVLRWQWWSWRTDMALEFRVDDMQAETLTLVCSVIDAVGVMYIHIPT